MGSTPTVLAAETIPNEDCMICHSDKELYKTNSAGEGISMFVDEAQFAKSVHSTNACVNCHSDLTEEHPDNEVAAKPVHCASCHARQSESYNASAHGLALAGGDVSAATCVDCHGNHSIHRPNSPESRLYFTKLAETCGECHPVVAEEVEQSVHGKSVAEGNRDAATCTDCHSEHKIEDLRKMSPIKVAQLICSKCHASERLSSKYRLPSDRVKTFMESYHGLASKYGSTRAANCASCHGVHLILPSWDARSTINTNNLMATCGKCHPGASENFVQGKIHVDEATGMDISSRASYWVRRLYLGLIGVTIGLMLAHNGLAWRRKAMVSFRSKDRTVRRMSTSQRLQHFILALSFIILAATGFALKYPDSWLAWLLGADETVRRWGHRISGAIMLGLGVYHLLYVIVTRDGRQLLKDFLPRGKDLSDVSLQVRHLAGHTDKRPLFGRFSYAEKLEYWAVVWGTIIMGVTGLMIWFKMDVTQFLPRWAVDVATTVHFYEAILACLAIVVWHFYHVVFDPHVYPINWAFWDGRVSAEWYRHEHPLDTEALAKAAPPKEQKHGSQPGGSGGLGSADEIDCCPERGCVHPKPVGGMTTHFG